jgi:alkylhydroperoxidase family enzyme
MELPEGPVRRFFESLNELWWSRGAPSGRRIAKELCERNVKISQGTVQNLINGPRISIWDNVARVVRHLGGDRETFLQLWVDAARYEKTARVKTASAARPREPDVAGFSDLGMVDFQSLVQELKTLRRVGLLRSSEHPLVTLKLASRMLASPGTEDALPPRVAITRLLRRAVDHLDGTSRDAAAVLFGLSQETADWPAADRRRRAAQMYRVSTERFRKDQEILLVTALAESVVVVCVGARAS